jgi:hypothetical protein
MDEIDIYITGLFSANSHLVTPDASRATTPVEEDVETFDPSRPSLSPSDSILLPISKIPGYLDVALKALTLHTEARTSFITYASSFLCSSYLVNLTERIPLFFLSCVFSLANSFFSDLPRHPQKKMGTVSNIFRGTDYLGADGHAGIGFRVCSNTNTSPCASSRKHRTKRRRSCASRPRPTSSPASSCSSAESAQTIWAFGPRRLLARLRRTGRRSGRRLSALMRCGRLTARYSVCWSGVGWKLCEPNQDGRAI